MAAASAMAQVPEPGATPPAIDVPVVPLPEPTPTPVIVPTPEASPTAAAEPALVPAPTPTPRRTPQPSPTPSPVPQPTARPFPAAPVATPAPTAAPVPVPPPVVAEPASATGGWLPWLLGAGALALIAILWRRSRRDTAADPVAGEGVPAPAPAPVPPGSDARLVLTLRPLRAGLNMVTAVADCELTVTNEGSVPAAGIRIALALVGAMGDQRAATEAANADPIARPLVPAFTLQPGEARTVRGVASASLDALPIMQAGGREMLVPLILVNLRHREADGAEHRTAQGFVIGVERTGSAKLAPFWLDSIRMIDQVAARPSGEAERRRIA